MRRACSSFHCYFILLPSCRNQANAHSSTGGFVFDCRNGASGLVLVVSRVGALVAGVASPPGRHFIKLRIDRSDPILPSRWPGKFFLKINNAQL